MRRLIIDIIAIMVVLCCVQCKKKDNEAIDYHKKAVNITLDVSDGARTNVNPSTGQVLFADGDEIIVANAGKYVGRLKYEDGLFSGTVTDPSTDDYLHFYHLGNKNTGTLIEGESTGCSVSIADQASFLPVISYAHSTEKYSSGVTTYTARLENKCALVKFDVTSLSDYAGTCITDMRNKVTVDFTDASFVYDKEGDGKITLASGSGERWAILLPQPEVAAGGDGTAFSGHYKGNRGSVPEINEGERLADGVAVTVETEMLPAGAINGLFTVDGNGKQVYFSQGNLGYKLSTGSWDFFKKQYYQVYKFNVNVGNNYSEEKYVEHFAWVTSGFNHGAEFFEPWNTTSTNSKYYAYGDPDKNLYDDTGMADWGYNCINNGGGAYKQWRTLTKDEWNYLLNLRTDAANKYSYASIKDGSTVYKGILLLPDDWTEPYSDCFTPGVIGDYSVNYYLLSDWQMMQAAGAVFLTNAGRRIGTSTGGVGLIGFYWSSSAVDSNESYCFTFTSEGIDEDRNDNKSNGCTLRLVCE